MTHSWDNLVSALAGAQMAKGEGKMGTDRLKGQGAYSPRDKPYCTMYHVNRASRLDPAFACVRAQRTASFSPAAFVPTASLVHILSGRRGKTTNDLKQSENRWSMITLSTATVW